MAVFDMADVLGLYNHERGSISCVGRCGHTSSKRRRCPGRIADHNIATGKALARKLPGLVTKLKSLRSTLFDIAGCFLCQRLHRGQAEGVVEEWYRSIRRVVACQQLELKQVTAKAPKNKIKIEKQYQDVRANAMLANAKQDTRSATSKHEDYGYGSDHSSSSGDENELSSLPQSSLERRAELAGSYRRRAELAGSYEHRTELAGLCEITVAVLSLATNKQSNNVEAVPVQCSASTPNIEKIEFEYIPWFDHEYQRNHL